MLWRYIGVRPDNLDDGRNVSFGQQVELDDTAPGNGQLISSGLLVLVSQPPEEKNEPKSKSEPRPEREREGEGTNPSEEESS